VAPTHPFRLLCEDEAAAGAPGPHDLVLAGSAFGGGSHPTTVSCLEVLAALAPLDGLEILDLGSGSGILALAALRLGAARATCVDVNPEAVASARRNGELNGLAGRLVHRQGTADALAGATFDLVVANIGGELLLDLASQVSPLARPGGRLLLSGLLAGWGDELAAAYARHGCTLLERRAPGAFCTLLLRRGRAASGTGDPGPVPPVPVAPAGLLA
jgi:ribosomal protein L11 methyltransferase